MTDNLLAVARALHDADYRASIEAEQLEPTEPELDITSLRDSDYDDMVAMGDPVKFMRAVVRAEKIPEYRRALAREIRALEPEPAPVKTYSKPTMAWRKDLEAIQERARQALANLEETEWEVLRSGPVRNAGHTYKTQALKHKDEYFMPGVWGIRSRMITDDKGIVLRGECQVRYLSDNQPGDDPESILVVTTGAGRPKRIAPEPE